MKRFDPSKADSIIWLALKEDIGKKDISAFALEKKNATAVLRSKSSGILCGISLIKHIYNFLDNSINVKCFLRDGQSFKNNSKIAEIQGPLRAILTGERAVINFISMLSGISTKTNKYVQKVKKSNAKIYDTRKTIPGMRYLSKYAVLVGGGCNHRMGLYDMVMFKDNHIANNGIKKIIRTSRSKNPLAKIEVEIEKTSQIKEVLDAEPDIIMLDNMTPAQIKKSINIIKKYSGKTKIEVSGGITLANVSKYAIKGVDRISVGDITHSFKTADFSLKVLK